MKTILTTLFTAIFLFSYSNAKAEDVKSWRASIGVGLGFKKNLRVENRYEHLDKRILMTPIPFVQGNVGRVSLGPQGLSFRAVGGPMMNVSLYIKKEGDRYQGLGMAPRKDSAFVGLSAKFSKYGLNVSKDINGRSKGMITQLSYGHFFNISESFNIRAGASLEWFDDKYAEYYYGVRKHEATATRREYHLNNYFQPGLNALSLYKLSENTTLTGIAGMKFVPKKMRNSPTMNGDKFEIGGVVGISYSL